MNKKRSKVLLVSCVLLVSMWACTTKKKPGSASQAKGNKQDTIAVLNALKLNENGSLITFEATNPLSPNIFKLSDPDRLVIDLVDTRLGAIEKFMEVNQGKVSEISLSEFDDAGGNLSRVVIVLAGSVDYSAQTEGNNVVLSLADAGESPRDEDFANAPDVPAPLTTDNLSLMDGAEEQFAADNSPIPNGINESFSGPRGRFVDMQYSTSNQGTQVRVLFDGPAPEYDDFMLDNPKRIVLDFKQTVDAYSGSKSLVLGTDEVSEIRLGKQNDSVRLVLDSPRNFSPGYSVSKEPNAIVVRVQNKALSASSSASPELASDMVSTPAVAPEISPVSDNQAAFASPAEDVLVNGIDFQNISPGNDQLTIQLNRSAAAYQTEQLNMGEVLVRIPGARFETVTLKNAIDTSAFPSSVLAIRPFQKGNDVEIIVETRSDTQFNMRELGSQLVFESSSVSVANQANTTEVAPAPLVTSNIQSDAVPVPKPAEKVMSASPVKKDYRYVHEEFMNDTVAQGEPLSRMAAILSGSVEGKNFSGRKISLDFKDADVRSIFRLIAEISQFNIIISDDVTGRITIRLDEVPWDQAFAIILQTRGLWFEKYGSIIRVAPANKLRTERESAAAAEAAAKAAKPLDVLFKPVSFAQADTLTDQVKSILSERGTVDIDSRTNTLIIKDVREHLEKAKRMVDILDTQTPQVTIESRIVEATTTFTRSFGIQWSGAAKFTSQTGNPTGVFFPNNVDVQNFALNFPVEAGFINSTASINLGSINNIVDLDLALAIGEQQGESKLVSAPKVTVLDNKSATISAGSRIPFLTQTANAGSNVRFENATTNLTVTPHITNDGSILMTISATRNEPNFAQLVQGNPIIDQRTANTEVLVKSGNTTVIGGIYSTQAAKSQSRFPILHKIPIIGALFRNYDRQMRRTELLIFVTPRIVGDEREAIKDVRS